MLRIGRPPKRKSSGSKLGRTNGTGRRPPIALERAGARISECDRNVAFSDNSERLPGQYQPIESLTGRLLWHRARSLSIRTEA